LRSVLFLCTGNSARSILAEAILNHLGRGRFRAYSAGSHPTGKVNPFALEVLREMRVPVEGARSKACPVWPGKPARVHWGVEDPAAATGSDEERLAAFRAAAEVLRGRIEVFLGGE